MNNEWVLIGRNGDSTKAIGPFSDADEAREMANTLGLPDVEWTVVPLMEPA